MRPGAHETAHIVGCERRIVRVEPLVDSGDEGEVIRRIHRPAHFAFLGGLADEDLAVEIRPPVERPGNVLALFRTGGARRGDPQRGLDIARRTRVGMFGVNLYEPDIGSPWGGRGASGVGSAYGPEGMDPYLTTKSVFLPSFR